MKEPLLAGVIGSPIGHSRSPILHGYWLKRYGISGAYVPLPVQPHNLERALRGMASLGFVGVSVTVPYKTKVADLVDSLDPEAARAGSVNMVTVLPDGRLEGRSTDGYGFLQNLREGSPNWLPGKGPVLVVGAGGAARAVLASLIAAGERTIRIVNRTDENAHAMVDLLMRSHEEHEDLNFVVIPWHDLPTAAQDCHLIVNTTTLGMVNQPPLDLPIHHAAPHATVTDIVYAPLETKLLSTARDHRLVGVDGLGMLLHQARPAFARWFGVDPDVDGGLRAAVLNSLMRR